MNTITENELSAALTMNANFAYKIGGALAQDLESAGREAIVRAMQTYERDKGKFATYARWFVRKAQIVERKNLLTPVRLPVNIYTPLESVGVEFVLHLAAPESEEPDFSALYRALADLALEERSVILARYFEGLKLWQIAVTLGISEGGVYGRLRRAEKRLGELLEMELSFN